VLRAGSGLAARVAQSENRAGTGNASSPCWYPRHRWRCRPGRGRHVPRAMQISKPGSPYPPNAGSGTQSFGPYYRVARRVPGATRLGTIRGTAGDFQTPPVRGESASVHLARRASSCGAVPIRMRPQTMLEEPWDAMDSVRRRGRVRARRMPPRQLKWVHGPPCNRGARNANPRPWLCRAVR
jgi:hypothetical protein